MCQGTPTLCQPCLLVGSAPRGTALTPALGTLFVLYRQVTALGRRADRTGAGEQGTVHEAPTLPQRAPGWGWGDGAREAGLSSPGVPMQSPLSLGQALGSHIAPWRHQAPNSMSPCGKGPHTLLKGSKNPGQAAEAQPQPTHCTNGSESQALMGTLGAC